MTNAPGTLITDVLPATGEQPTYTPSELLTAAVKAATGNPESTPREGQARLSAHIEAIMPDRGACAAVAPTGSGKSLVTLSAAFSAALRFQERTVISTDSLSLMGQMENKDVPTMQDAAAAMGAGGQVEVAFVKGISNYVDPAKVIATAQTLTGLTARDYSILADRLAAGARLQGVDEFGDIGDEDIFRDLCVWALRQYTPTHLHDTGDRHSCPIEHTTDAWAAVSSSSSEADDGAAFGVRAKAEVAKDSAEGADIIITNHSILAVQAANALPIIVGSTRYGAIDHIIVDEAHTLPGHVRNQGASKLSGGSIIAAARRAHKAAGTPSGSMQGWMNDAEVIAESVEGALAGFLTRGDSTRRLTEADTVLDDLAQVIADWASAGQKQLSKHQGKDVSSKIKVQAASDRLEKLGKSAKAFSRHRTSWARWVEQDTGIRRGAVKQVRAWHVANVAPVNVGWLLNDNLWTYTGDTGDKVRVSATCISATLPTNFPQQAGMDTTRAVYPSPFADAYARSALYIPQADDETLPAITKEGWNGRRVFDGAKHAEWAKRRIVALVRASNGRALILAAKAADGKAYAEQLRRELPNLTVYSQWDGSTPARVVSDWRDDERSVLVGTKSLMTGVDAPGNTCSLVILDRIPRSPSNPIDDARAEDIESRTGDKWGANREVYAVDAGLLLAQATGRLIRSVGDTGMACVLDPRLLKLPGGKRGPLTYPEPTRKIYMEALYPFGQKMTVLDQATVWLEQHNSEN